MVFVVPVTREPDLARGPVPARAEGPAHNQDPARVGISLAVVGPTYM